MRECSQGFRHAGAKVTAIDPQRLAETSGQPEANRPVISNRQLTLYIEQSNLIEGIRRPLVLAEFDAHKQFLSLDQINLPDLQV